MKIRFLSLLMVMAILIVSIIPYYAFADDDVDTSEATTVTEEATTAPAVDSEGKTQEDVADALEKRKAEIEADLAEALEKLESLEGSSKVTQEYIDALDQKIGYLNEELTVLEAQNEQVQTEIDILVPVIEEIQGEVDAVLEEIDAAKEELSGLEETFQTTYDAYCFRLRVMYISGDYNILSALMSCDDISTFLTRFEMIRSVAKSDTELLEEVNAEMEVITTKRDGLNEKMAEYEQKNAELEGQKEVLEEKQAIIEANQKTIAESKLVLASDRAESDSLLATLNSQNKQYTEFRNEDDELIAQVESEIQDLISGVKSPDDIVIPELGDRTLNEDVEGSSGGDVYANSNAVLNMTYPAPGYYSISAGFPNYSSGRYHGGIDYPCPTGTNIVAAQSGIVLTVKRLNYSYGYYVMIYHGTDALGRSVVTLYAHNSSILVSPGQSVARGETIAKSGSTGNSTGPHCHFEVRFDGTRVNPKNYLS